MLWAPWRMAYIEGRRPERCIFCVEAQPQESWRERLILAVTDRSVVMLNKFPYNNGHLLVAPRGHKPCLEELSAREFSDLMTTLRRGVAAVNELLRPQGANVGMNLGKCAGAGIEGHLHWHVVPRWEGDTNFMPVTGETKVISEHLMHTYDRLRPFFGHGPG